MRKPLELLAELVAPFDPILARVWLIGPGDLCDSCSMRSECPARERCLHLEASVGLSSRIDGPFQRFPLAARQMGRVVQQGTLFVARAELAALGLAEGAWLRAHRARSFAAVPIPGRQHARGALALFSRASLTDEEVRGLGAIAGLLSLALSEEPLPLRDVEREAIERALALTRGRVSGPRGAARILGLKPTTLHSRMLKLGVRRLSSPSTPQ